MPGIVVGVDGSEASLRAVDWAAAEAARRRVGLTLCVAVYGPPEEAVLWTGPHMTPMLADQVMQRAADRARDAAAGVPVDVRTVIATPTRGLLGQAAEADLLVVGSRGLGAFTGLLVGSVSEQVAEHATCPVVVVRGEPSNPNLPVLVGVDGSAANQPAVEFAFAAAEERHVGLVALAAVPPVWITPPVGYAITPPVPHPADQLREAGPLLEQAVRQWAEKYPQVPVEQRPVLGPGGARADPGQRLQQPARRRQPRAWRAGRPAARLGQPARAAACRMPGRRRPQLTPRRRGLAALRPCRCRSR